MQTIAQIRDATKRKQRYRPFGLARAIALTEFLTELEAEHKNDFRITTAYPALSRLVNEPKDAEPVFTLGIWAGFAIGDTEYFFEMNENPFLLAGIMRKWRSEDGKTERSEYLEEMNGILYRGTERDAEPKTISTLLQNYRDALSEVNERHPKTYSRDVPAYDRKNKQRIYYGDERNE